MFALAPLAACVSAEKIDTPPGSGGAASEGSKSSASSSMASSGGTSDGSGASPPVSTDPCAKAEDGARCGGDLGGIAEHTSVYTCSGGATTGAAACKSGCASGACLSSPADPCGSAPGGSGFHCGETLTGGLAKTLYECTNGAASSTTSCATGCKVNPPGTADACNPPSDPCKNAPRGDGAYCAASLAFNSGGAPNVLYMCKANKTSQETTCPGACQANPPGVADVCAPTGSGQCCVAVPPGALIGAFSACGGSGNHHGMDYGTAEGTPIYAGVAGTVVSTREEQPNCYENGCSEACSLAYNYVLIRADCGDPTNPVKDLYVDYLHIKSLFSGIKAGVHVSQGQIVAYSGNSGCSSLPHIHVEVISMEEGEEALLGTCASVNPTTRFCN